MMLYVPGEYFPAELDVLDHVNGLLDSSRGWIESRYKHVATQEQLLLWANVVDPWNPLFNDEEYAEKSKHGSLIAAPLFGINRYFGQNILTIPPIASLGHWQGLNDGFDVEYFCPIRPFDSFKIWRERPTLNDATNVDGGNARVFELSTSFVLYNQNGEKTLAFTTYMRNVFSLDARAVLGVGKWGRNNSTNQYSAMDWERIREIENQESIRGANPRYWEFVNVGDSLNVVVDGPTTVLDMVRYRGGDAMIFPPMRNALRGGGSGLDQDESGIYHLFEEGHYAGERHKGGRAIHYQMYGPQLATRLLNNYIGDAGWIRKLSSRHGDKVNQRFDAVDELQERRADYHGRVGDTIVARGKVLKKYVEGGERLVDLVIWTETLNAQLSQVMTATVSLPHSE